MPAFADRLGRAWVVEIDCACVLDWGAELSLDLSDLDKMLGALAKQIYNPLSAAEYLWVAVRSQAAGFAPPVTKAEFVRALPADTDAWRGALEDAIGLFFRGRRAAERAATPAPSTSNDSSTSSPGSPASTPGLAD